MSSQPHEPQNQVALQDGNVVYSSSSCELWQIPVAELAVIGEYTTPNGPLVDDYFLVFITKKGALFTASFYSEGRDRLLFEFGRLMGSDVVPGLANSTDYASRVMWPGDLRDQQLFEWAQLQPATILERVIQKVAASYEMRLTDAVAKKIEPR
jgi:hypothetical protein